MDDLAPILDSIRATMGGILSRLDALEQAQRDRGAEELVVPGGWGYCSPTSPPTGRILVRRGIPWIYDSIWFAPAIYSEAWPDFQPPLPISAFTDAYYYRAVVCFLDVDYSVYPLDGFDVWEDTEDYLTFEECAASFSEKLGDWSIELDAVGDPVFPLCAIAVRNNGTTGAVNEYEAITLSDRDKSSFIQRDLRPWFGIARVA